MEKKGVGVVFLDMDVVAILSIFPVLPVGKTAQHTAMQDKLDTSEEADGFLIPSLFI